MYFIPNIICHLEAIDVEFWNGCVNGVVPVWNGSENDGVFPSAAKP